MCLSVSRLGRLQETEKLKKNLATTYLEIKEYFYFVIERSINLQFPSQEWESMCTLSNSKFGTVLDTAEFFSILRGWLVGK